MTVGAREPTEAMGETTGESLVKLFAIPAMLAAVVLDGWWLVVSFAGGTMPLLGIRVGHGGWFAFVWLFVLSPIALTVEYWAYMLLALALGGIVRLVVHTWTTALSIGAGLSMIVLAGLGAFGAANHVHITGWDVAGAKVAVVDNSGVCAAVQAFVVAGNANDVQAGRSAFEAIATAALSAGTEHLPLTPHGWCSKRPPPTRNHKVGFSLR